MGIGLALIGRSLHRDEWIVLGLCGALLHVWNHALFKALLFLSAGSVIHATHTREIDHLGGLGRKMPWTAGLFLIGAVAICGLPPLNGFVSEFFLYLGFFSTVRETVEPVYGAAAFAAPILALIGALAVACFVKVFTTIFLGTPRSTHSDHASESKLAMIAPMVVLAACCLIIGLAPQGLPLVLDRSVRAWAPEIGERLPLLSEVAPLWSIGMVAVSLVVAILLGSVAFGIRLRATTVTATTTWGCAYVQPSPRMQYTSSSFAQMLVALFAKALLPITQCAPHQRLVPFVISVSQRDARCRPGSRDSAGVSTNGLADEPPPSRATWQYPVVLVVRVRRAAVAFALEIRGVNYVRSLVMDAARCRGAGCRAAAIGRH